MSNIHALAAARGWTLRPWDDDGAGHLARFRALVEVPLFEGTRHGQPMRLEFGLIDDPTINAGAYAFDTADVITVNTGVFGILRETARAMASQKVFKRHNHRSLAGKIVSKASVTDVRIGRVPPLDAFGTKRPTKLATDIYNAAVLFVLLHEFAHINNGHCEYVKLRGKAQFIAELPAIGSMHGSLERETIEWDADSWAIQQLLGWALEPVVTHHDGRSAWKIPSKNHLGSEDYALTVVLAAVCMIGFYFSDRSGPYDASEFGTHPHPRIRLLACSGSIAHTYAFRTGREFDPRINEYTANSLKAWMNTFPDADLEIIQNVTFWMEAFHARVELYNQAWERLYDVLNANKRHGTLAPKAPTLHPAFPTNDVFG